jgi:hypothetical protein
MSRIKSLGQMKERLVFLSVLVFSLFYVNHALALQLGMSSSNAWESSELDTLPMMSKQSTKIHKIENDKEVKMSFENGELVDLEIDGEVIPKDEFDKYENLIDSSRPQTKSFGNGQKFMFGDSFSDDVFSFQLGNLDSIFNGIANSGLKIFRKLDDWDGLDNFNSDLWERPMDMLKKLFENEDFGTFNIDTSFNFQFKNFGDAPLFDELIEDEISTNNSNFAEILGNSLNKDELLIPNQTNKIELTGKYLKINGERQPTNIWNKYKRIFEETSGSTLQKSSKIVFDFEGKAPKRKYRSF